MKYIVAIIFIGMWLVAFFDYVWFLMSPIEIAKPEIVVKVAHITKDGTMWIEYEGSSYYLYLEDNGEEKRLEMK